MDVKIYDDKFALGKQLKDLTRLQTHPVYLCSVRRTPVRRILNKQLAILERQHRMDTRHGCIVRLNTAVGVPPNHQNRILGIHLDKALTTRLIIID